MIYLVITKKEIENKHFYVLKFIQNLYKYISRSPEIIAVSKNTINLEILKLYKDSHLAKNFVSIDSSNVVLNGFNIAYDKTLEFVSKINALIEKEFGIEKEKSSDKEDFDILKQFSKIHYINSEFQTVEEAIKDFKSQDNENERCVIVNVFEETKNTYDDERIAIINMPLEESKNISTSSNKKTYEQLANSMIDLSADMGGSSIPKCWDFDAVFSSNSLKIKT